MHSKVVGIMETMAPGFISSGKSTIKDLLSSGMPNPSAPPAQEPPSASRLPAFSLSTGLGRLLRRRTTEDDKKQEKHEHSKKDKKDRKKEEKTKEKAKKEKKDKKKRKRSSSSSSSNSSSSQSSQDSLSSSEKKKKKKGKEKKQDKRARKRRQDKAAADPATPGNPEIPRRRLKRQPSKAGEIAQPGYTITKPVRDEVESSLKINPKIDPSKKDDEWIQEVGKTSGRDEIDKVMKESGIPKGTARSKSDTIKTIVKYLQEPEDDIVA